MNARTEILSAREARTLLCRLRDLNLSACRVAVSENTYVLVAGCVSRYGPVESGVRYRVGLESGETCILSLQWIDDALELSIVLPRPNPDAEVTRRVSLVCDASGRALAPDFFAVCSPDSTDLVELEEFLTRLVAGMFSRYLSLDRLTA